MLHTFEIQRARVGQAHLLEDIGSCTRLARGQRCVGNDREAISADHCARPARGLVVNGTRHRFVIAAWRPADQERVVGRRRVFDVAPQAEGDGAGAGQHALGPVPRLAQELLRDLQLELELLVAAAQLLLQRADGQMRPDARQHLLGLERLVDEINRAELETAHLVVRGGQR
jgi:hypothetical protein